MLHKVFIALWKHPLKDDWTEEVIINPEEFDIRLSFDEIKAKSVNSFKRLLGISKLREGIFP